MIDGCKLLAILPSLFAMLNLGGHGRNALLARGSDFRRSRSASNAAGAVVADAIHGGVVDSRVVNRGVGDRAVVDLYVAGVYVVDGTVVVEAISVPIPALITGSGVAVSVIDAAVVADVPAPVAVVIAIAMAIVSPPSGSP
jgi:hypothetical protein